MFRSFFMGGFESATGFNRSRRWIDQIAATEHDIQAGEDYARLAQMGLLVARDAIRWPLVDRGGQYDFSSIDPVLEAGRRHGVQIIWDLFHYGYPSDLNPFSDEFVLRFADYCEACALYLDINQDGPHMFTPVNEPSYFAWAAGDAGLFAPHATGRSFELKVQIVRAAIAGMNAIRAILPDSRFINADPLCRVAPPKENHDLDAEVCWFNEHVVFQSWDMLAGRSMPELGGNHGLLDIVGLNYYWTNQWEHQHPEVPLDEADDRCWPLRDLVRWVWHRYGHEMIVSETSHWADKRGPYLHSLADEAEAILNEGIPLRGICLYPVLGMPDWHEEDKWANMGLWDLEQTDKRLKRVPHPPAIDALREAQERLEGLAFPRGNTFDDPFYLG